MQSLLNPRSIAVVGASPQGLSRGTAVLRNLRLGGFGGDLFAINPKYDEIEGVHCYAAADKLPQPVDCLVIAVNAEASLGVLELAFEQGTASAVILSSGFGEGGRHGRRVARLRALAERGMRICGPNGFGLYNLRDRVAMFSGPMEAGWPVGPVALVSQSGGMTTYISKPLMTERGIGFSHLVSCGNQIGTTVEDYFEYFVEDPEIRVLAAYVEGLLQPDKFERVAARAIELDKQVLIFNAGLSRGAQEAVHSHTGSLAPSPDLFAAFLRRCGAIQVGGLTDMCEAIELFTTLRKRTAGRDVIVVSGSGGEAAYTADCLAAAGVKTATLSPETAKSLTEILPDFGTVGNPIDPTGSVFQDPALFRWLLEAIDRDRSSGALLVSIGARGAANPMMMKFAQILGEFAPTTKRPIIAFSASALGGLLNPEAVAIFHNAGIPFLGGTDLAVKAVRLAHDHWTISDRLRESGAPPSIWTAGTPRKITSSGGMLPFMSAKGLLEEFGIEFAQTGLAQSANDAVTLAAAIGYPVVVKADANGLAHRTDIGGVRVNCRNEESVRMAFDDVSTNAKIAGYSQLHGVLIQPMVPFVAETIAGIKHDPALGPAVVFGLGGIFVEILRDVVIEMPPITLDRAREMIGSLKASTILFGARGSKPADVDALARILMGLGNFAVAHRNHLKALDINPILVGTAGEGAKVVDVLMEFGDDF